MPLSIVTGPKKTIQQRYTQHVPPPPPSSSARNESAASMARTVICSNSSNVMPPSPSWSYSANSALISRSGGQRSESGCASDVCQMCILDLFMFKHVPPLLPDSPVNKNKFNSSRMHWLNSSTSKVPSPDVSKRLNIRFSTVVWTDASKVARRFRGGASSVFIDQK